MNALRLVSAVRNGSAHCFKAPQTFLPLFYNNKVPVRLQSSQPVSAARLPCRVKVSAGRRYAWCACGHSKKQPFCDGAHKASAPDISPLRFTPDKDQTVLLCACKQTKNAPYCDGSHFKVIYRDVVKSVKGFFK
ncbi:CDGSH iron-sulfur domain-containing protein 3, mitochondrial-like [Gouania willdenowi]|uniref:CDGSH iron-sulfur domain-containing protein 3, mitochondrial-like n=1 Tax=Gouania willdenowi TaxID=441366 RepID=UPI001054A68F|nr:CDGSH iron-sulfur domain-containing protein 3, mitochondrial-like [Gouania willdenowi]